MTNPFVQPSAIQAGRRPRKGKPRPSVVPCPFTVVIDSREQAPYTFAGLRANKAQHDALLEVPIVRDGLSMGDYSILGFEPPKGRWVDGSFDIGDPTGRTIIAIERKSKADLFNSIAKRANFEERLAVLGIFTYAAVMVECEMSSILAGPPEHSHMDCKSVHRTILAWRQRYAVDWHFYPSRAVAEAATFRILERFYLDHSGNK